MDWTGDELAGIVDLFGGLTRSELASALAELAFKRGEAYDPDAFEGVIDEATETYHLVAVSEEFEAEPDADDVDAESVLVVGPVAFPELPDGATDLPHILDADERDVDRETAARAAERRFRTDAAAAASAGDAERIDRLLDVSYELEAWGPVDLSAARDRLDAAR